MPELPEVETVRRGLAHALNGRQIQGADVLLARSVAYPESPTDFVTALRGTTLVDWQRRGKYLLGQLAREQVAAGWLGIHLRMTGSLWFKPEGPPSIHTRIRLFLDGGDELRFSDTRTFGRMWAVPPDCPPEKVITGLQKLGPEPFSEAFSSDYLYTALHRRQRPLKSALLDQELVAGVGNIYADEALFTAGLSPTLPGSQITPEQAARLQKAVRSVLQAGINSGGSSFSNFQNVQGVLGNYLDGAQVFRRTGAPCPTCGTPVARIKLAGRSTHFCPTCQAPAGTKR
ncbi:DNA-formamidopyrimidine glycosylase [Leptolyngbya sp. FACHB-261]|uniref:DNA-formamidopyrimidine glycosylase n=1 Tax=Leptolyngbya sp. FACHB-261 TaxID=2692806 RepID=UPI00168A1ABC|nr:DNA-formamidopyrimidine glycosylase [Leptolyngbya sp. FACHB-261]MBD2104229.1 DNA-formamidopyrimidine glycosylase [Leptolyngbya sp. FACHB-261]